ncbi:MAG: response regulator transcription factor [Nitrospirota bacterium]
MVILINISSYLCFEGIRALLVNEQCVKKPYYVECKASIGDLKPSIIIVDKNGLDDELLFKCPEAKFVILDTGLTQEEIATILNGYRIHGLLSTTMNLDLFKKALRVINDGEVWIDNHTIKTLLHKKAVLHSVSTNGTLTQREREIVNFIGGGYTNKEIASKLSLSEQTVKSHLNRIFKKLKVSSRTQLVALSFSNKKLH